jgi:hypothetical protein
MVLSLLKRLISRDQQDTGKPVSDAQTPVVDMKTYWRRLTAYERRQVTAVMRSAQSEEFSKSFHAVALPILEKTENQDMIMCILLVYKSPLSSSVDWGFDRLRGEHLEAFYAFAFDLLLKDSYSCHFSSNALCCLVTNPDVTDEILEQYICHPRITWDSRSALANWWAVHVQHNLKSFLTEEQLKILTRSGVSLEDAVPSLKKAHNLGEVPDSWVLEMFENRRPLPSDW